MLNIHWKTKDKNWLASRKLQWKQLADSIKYYHGSSFQRADLKKLEKYFIFGERDAELESKYPDIFLEIAWHPSESESDWLIELQEHIRFHGRVHFHFYNADFSSFYRQKIAQQGIEPSVLLNREKALCDFFFGNNAVTEMLGSTSGSYYNRNYGAANLCVQRIYNNICTSLEHMLSDFKAADSGGRAYEYCYFGFVRHIIPYLPRRYTTAFYQDLVDKKDWKYMFVRLKMVARLYACLEQYPLQQQQIIQEWVTQIEKSAPEWREAWLQLKHQEAQTYTPKLKSAVAMEDDAKPSETRTESATNYSKRATWPESYARLKETLFAQGFTLQQEAEPGLHSILDAFFPSKSILFGIFSDTAYSADDLTEPFDAFTYPLQRLCELSDSHQMSYQQKGDYLYLKADGKQVGKIYLDDPLDEGSGKDGVANYFKQVVKLAQQWFPGQVYCYGEDEFVLYLLPETVVVLLEQQGFASKPDYFG